MKLNEMLCGAVVKNVEEGEDFLCIFFDGGERVSIYNRYLIEPSPGEIGQILGAVSFIDEIQPAALRFHFENGTVLSVGLRNEDYLGPEALQVRLPGDKVIVWN